MKKESNKNRTTCLRLNTGDGSPRVFLLNSHFFGVSPRPLIELKTISIYEPLEISYDEYMSNCKH